MAGKIIYIMGPSACGKDTIYKELLQIFQDKLDPVIQYTTRPMRPGEVDGREYYFIDNNKMNALKEANKIIEWRKYTTVHGIWTYATVDDGKSIMPDKDYIGIGTFESLIQIRDYLGKENVIAFYLDVNKDIRMQRVVDREVIGNHDYDEMCRRWILDSKDFSEENIKAIDPIIIPNNAGLDSAILHITKIIIKNI